MNDFAKLNILLVDDDEIDILAFERALKKAEIPYKIETCTYAAEALQLLEETQNSFDAIFIDYLLPDFDGLQLLKELKARKILAPISVITSHGDEKIAVEIMKAGAFDYFPKSEVRSEKMIKKAHSIIRYNQIQNDKRKVELALEKQKHFLEGITQSSTNIIYILNIQEFKYTYSNRNILDDLGYKIIKNSFSDYEQIKSYMHPDDIKNWDYYIENIRNSTLNKVFEREFRLKSTQGEWIWFFNRDTVYTRSDNNKVVEIIGTSTNISNLKKVEQEYAKAREMAEKALQIKAEFLSNMSHEIRTPMNAIIGLTDIVLQESLNNGVKDNLKLIKQSADNLLVVINDVLDISKLEAGKVTIETITFNFPYQLDHIAKTMAFNSANKNLYFQVDIDPEIPQFLVGDPYRINQILLNLCSNAIKFTESGYVKVLVKLVNSTSKKATVYFCVEDSGIGISEKAQKQIFESFTQADVNITRQFGGTGLGLTISKQLLQLMGGEIQLESEPGKGSRFYFTLTFDIGKPMEADNESKVFGEKSLAGLKVLVFEDNIINQKVISQILEKWSVKFTLADNGLQGLEILKDIEFDIVLMDLQMPVMDGFTATKEIRMGKADIRNIRIPIIALTADAFPETREKVLNQGMNDLVSKPFKKQDLNHKIYNIAMKHCPEQLALRADGV